MRTAFFTICTNSYIAYARVLMDGIARHHPEALRYVVLADEPHIDLSGDNFEVILARDLGIPTFESLTFRYNVTELCTALKPHVFLHLFRRGVDICLYLDPDISIFAPLTEALTAVTDGQAALTPHRLGPQTTTGWPDDHQLLQVGAYNLGFVALRHTPEVAERVTWWARQLEHGCVVNLPEGLFVDQKWMDLWPSFCSGTAILRHPGYNVAYWNLAERKVEKRSNGFEVNGVPLVFFHFSGVMPDRRDLLSRYRQFLTGANIGSANELLQAYIAELQRKGFDEHKALPCAYSFFDNGVLIPPFGRSLYRRNEGAFPDPRRTVFSALQAAASGAAGAELTVAAVELWELRKDLQAAFDIDTPEGQHGFARWFVDNAHREDVDSIFVKPVVDRMALNARSAAARSFVPTMARLAVAAYARSDLLRRMWRRLPTDFRERMRKTVFRIAYVTDDSDADTPALREGVLLIGHPKAASGVGQAMRSLAEICRAGKIPFAANDFGFNADASHSENTLDGELTRRADFNCNVFCINADQWPVAQIALRSSFFARRYNILRPFWELAALPKDIGGKLTGLQEIWAPTAFVASAFRAATGCPVEIIPVAVQVGPVADMRRADFRLPERSFLFFFFFDYASYVSRKNPKAIVAAFRKAFPRGTENVGLVIKSHGTGAPEDRLGWLEEYGDDPRIHVIDRTLPREQVNSLTKLTDCFVSLHRSEGFGFGMAEAMALGKPVIGTDYSGSRDFLSQATGFPVGYQLIPVAPGAYPGHEDQVWADPDVEQAADLMRKVASGGSDVAARAEAGRRFIAEHHSPAAVARQCRARLVELGLLGAAR